MGSMSERSNKRIILAHGLKGEMGVPASYNKNGLPWPRLPEDIQYLKDEAHVLILGRTSYELAKQWLGRDRLLLCVTHHPGASKNHYRYLTDAFEAAEQMEPGVPAYVGGGAILARSAFSLLQYLGEGEYHETVVHDTYPHATTHMKPFNESAWTQPERIAEYPERYIENVSTNGLVLHRRIPAFHIQVRSVK